MSKKKHKQGPEATICYICDQMACQPCSHDDTGCSHTLDISHAKNFKQIRPGLYIEQEVKDPTFLQAETLNAPDNLESLHQTLVDTVKDGGIVILPKQFTLAHDTSTQIGF